MLAKKNRVQRALFPYVLAKGRTYSSQHMFARLVQNPISQESQSKFSFVVSIKVAKRAVDRHALRRAGYAVIEKERKNLKDGFIAVFFIAKNAKNITKDTVQDEVCELLKKMPLYRT